MAKRGPKPGSTRANPYVYALYDGDEFVDVGTMAELMARTGLSEDTLRSYQSPSYQKRTRGLKRILIKLEGTGPKRREAAPRRGRGRPRPCPRA